MRCNVLEATQLLLLAIVLTEKQARLLAMALTKSNLVVFINLFFAILANNKTQNQLTMVFATSCRPRDFIPNTPWENDENGLDALVAVFQANKLEEKKNSKQAPRRATKRKLMSPDDV